MPLGEARRGDGAWGGQVRARPLYQTLHPHHLYHLHLHPGTRCAQQVPVPLREGEGAQGTATTRTHHPQPETCTPVHGRHLKSKCTLN
jgi:hypothetical protein